MPAGSRPMITDREFVIANISAPSALKSSDDDDEVVESVESTDEGEENSDNNSE